MNYAFELIEKGKRIDGRKFDEFRKIFLQEGIIKNAEGSARVRLGETEVVAGVKLELGTPFPDTPEEGILIVNAEFSPIASPDFEPGPPSEDAIELGRIVDRGIRESKCVELEKLCLIPKEKVWCVFVDIHIINHQGNLLDASALASIAALRNAKIPKIENDKVIRGESEKQLPVIFKPINVTVAKIGNNFILDPLLEEEEIANSKLSICVRDDDKICALQKQGSGTFKFEEVEKALDLAIRKSKELRSLIK
jgi:exosome complex component RRP42